MKKIFFSLFAASFSFGAFAQTSTAVTANTTQTVTLNLQNQIDISIGTATGTSFTFSSPAHYTSGLSNTNASTFQVRSNRPWAVTVNAATATFNGPANNSMPASKLSVRLAGVGDYNPLSTTAANFTAGARGTQTFNVDYNANPGFDYDAGTYTLGVVYTATQQ